MPYGPLHRTDRSRSRRSHSRAAPPWDYPRDFSPPRPPTTISPRADSSAPFAPRVGGFTACARRAEEGQDPRLPAGGEHARLRQWLTARTPRLDLLARSRRAGLPPIASVVCERTFEIGRKAERHRRCRCVGCGRHDSPHSPTTRPLAGVFRQSLTRGWRSGSGPCPPSPRCDPACETRCAESDTAAASCGPVCPGHGTPEWQ